MKKQIMELYNKYEMSRFFEGRLQYLTLFLAGGVADFALAPFYIFPVLFASFPLFFIILNKQITPRQAFKTGWMFGFGYFVFGLYWIANSLLVDLRFAWLIPFAVAGIPFLLGIYTGLVAVVYNIVAKKLNITGKVIFLAALWLVFEMLRGWLFTGFPWNLLGYTALASLTFAQNASIFGVYGLSFFAVIISLIPVYYGERKFLAFTLAIIIGGFAFGSYHMGQSKAEPGREAAKIIVFQPNVAQTMKWDRVQARVQFLQNIEYIKTLAFKDKDIILWPETGVPYYLNTQPWVEEALREAAPENGLLITGGLRSEGETPEDYKVWNTLYAVSKEKIYQSYDKIHLVPFGEFVPFRDVLPLEKITPGSLDFSKGKGREIIKYKSGPSFLPLICYEVIFPGYSTSQPKPDLLVNATNDGWFGNSTGPYQHLATAQMRSIEQGVPMLRAANTGVSAVIDEHGKVLQSIGYGEHGHIEIALELKKAVTMYNLYGEAIVLGLILTSLIYVLIFGRNGKTSLA